MVGQIDGTIGYDDPASFRRVFQRVMGLSPSDYRRQFAVMHQARGVQVMRQRN